jgi:hypothetical protein
MTPAEEQILRNQMAIFGILSAFVAPAISNQIRVTALERGKRCVDETVLLLRTEHEQGRTAHAYIP